MGATPRRTAEQAWQERSSHGSNSSGDSGPGQEAAAAAEEEGERRRRGSFRRGDFEGDRPWRPRIEAEQQAIRRRAPSLGGLCTVRHDEAWQERAR